MPNNTLDEMLVLAGWYTVIAAAALPLALLLRIGARPAPRRLPRLETPIMLAFVLLSFAAPMLTHEVLKTSQAFMRWNLADELQQQSLARIVGAGVWLAAFAAWHVRFGRSTTKAATPSSWRRQAAAGIFGFIIITPITLAVYLLALAAFQRMGGTPDKHPLMDLDLAGTRAKLLFIGTACVAAPILEEAMFRGLLLPWSRHRRHRPWVIFTAACGLLLLAREPGHSGAILFLVDATIIMMAAAYGREVWKKWPSRTASAVVCTAILFAVMHAAIWPTPYPLAVMGLGLGILAVRTGSFWPCVVTHGLFNLVSVLSRLGGAG